MAEPRGFVEPTDVHFQGGPLDGTKRRMVDICDVLFAWAHRQAKGIVAVTSEDEGRQSNLWDRHIYLRSCEGDNYAVYVFSPDWEQVEEGDDG